MKKSWMIAASLLATTALAGDALAIDTSPGGYNGAAGRPMSVPGDGLAGFVDAMVPIGGAAGALGPGCGYILSWRNPLIPAPKFVDNRLCTVVETSALSQGCALDQTTNIAAFVTSFGNACTGFNPGGLADPTADLALAELPGAGFGNKLVGTVSYFGGAIVLPLTL